MGTRAIVRVFNHDQEILCIYRHMDGYPSGVGQEIKDFAENIKIVNGLGCGDAKVANGMGCFAAQLVAHLKDGPGSVYIEATGTKDMGEEYTYILAQDGERVTVQVSESPVTAFGCASDKGTHNHLFAGLLSEMDTEALEGQYH